LSGLQRVITVVAVKRATEPHVIWWYIHSLSKSNTLERAVKGNQNKLASYTTSTSAIYHSYLLLATTDDEENAQPLVSQTVDDGVLAVAGLVLVRKQRTSCVCVVTRQLAELLILLILKNIQQHKSLQEGHSARDIGLFLESSRSSILLGYIFLLNDKNTIVRALWRKELLLGKNTKN
jgi:hypothetical protein